MPYIANKSNVAQLTNIHYWDSAGNAWSGNLVGAATPFAFLPNPVIAGDLVLFGIDSTILNSGPFCSLVFDIGAVITDVTGITWKYSDAGGGVLPTAWAALAVQDNTDQDGVMTGVAFDTSGVRSVHWAQHTLWVVQNPTIGGVALGVTGLWICAHVTIAGGAGAPPTQNNRDIYTITWPSVSIPEPGGDMQALLRVRAREQTHFSQTRLVAGLRRASRGTDFRSYINFADEQNPLGITVTPFGTGNWATDVTTPTGRKITTTNPGALALIAYVELSEAYADQYRGTFRMFLRCTQTTLPTNVVSFQVRQFLGPIAAVSLLWTSPTVTTTAFTPDIEYLDMGQVSIPGTKSSSRPFSLAWGIYSSGDGVADAEILDMQIIPVDEWAVDTYSTDLLRGARSVAATLGYCDDIDGITEPKNIPFAVSTAYATGTVWEEPRLIGGKNGLIPNTVQHLHVLTMDNHPGTWRAELYAAESIEMWWVQRYSSMRGAR